MTLASRIYFLACFIAGIFAGLWQPLRPLFLLLSSAVLLSLSTVFHSQLQKKTPIGSGKVMDAVYFVWGGAIVGAFAFLIAAVLALLPRAVYSVIGPYLSI